MIDIFSANISESAKEKCGLALAAQDAREERHARKKSEQEYYDDFLHNLDHPFMGIVFASAENHANNGTPFVLGNIIITMLTTNENARMMFYSDDAWRMSGNALVAKYLKEQFPTLNIPKMQLYTKGTKQLLEAYPDKFVWLREALNERLEKEVGQ